MSLTPFIPHEEYVNKEALYIHKHARALVKILQINLVGDVGTIILETLVYSRKRLPRIFILSIINIQYSRTRWVDEKAQWELNFSTEAKIHYRQSDEEKYYYSKPLIELAFNYIENKDSLTDQQRERLINESFHQERQILEQYLPPSDPILQKINQKMTVETKSGLRLQI